MDPNWAQDFGRRFASLEVICPRPAGSAALSVKVRVVSGCFHREHSPAAYAILDKQLDSAALAKRGILFEEHESGPELLAWLLFGTAVTQAVKEVVGLVAEIIKARAAGAREGDRQAPVEIVIRGLSPQGKYDERTVLRIDNDKQADQKKLERLVDDAIADMFGGKD